MSRWDRLLAVQEHDTHADQVAHRSATLPVRTTLANLETAAATLDEKLTDVHERLSVLKRSQSRLEDEVSLLEAKATKADQQLYSGNITSPRELQSIQDEIASIKTRVSELEDEQLEVMEARDPVEAEQAELDSERAQLQQQIDAARAELAEAEAAAASELAEIRQRRAEVAEGLPAEALAEYEQLRARFGGVAIARLSGSTCQGCHLQLSAVEYDRIRKLPADEPVHCEECGRLLVR